MVKEMRMYLNTMAMCLLAIFMITGVISNLNITNPIYGNAFAQSANPNIDPQAAEILQNMSYFLGSKDEYTFKAEVMFDQLVNSNRKIQYSAEQKVYLKKKGNMTIEYVSDLGGYKLWFDNGATTILELPTNLVATTTLPATIDQALTKLKEQYNFTPSLSDFLFINTFRALTSNVTSGSYFGTSKVFGVRCDHLAFVQNDIDWQIWIEVGKRQIPRKIVITYKELPGQPQFIAIMKDWVLDKPITNFAFKADIPKLNQPTEMSEILSKPRMNMGSVRSSMNSF
ncbi:MAG: DUF2092 domain-containing protein [Thermodesulfobacteriota bacterium]